MKKNLVRFSVDISPDLNQRLESLAEKTHVSKGEILKRGLVLMEAASQARDRGSKIGAAKPDVQLETEFIVF